MKSKKAQLFSILAILVLSLMFVSFELYSFIHKRDVIKTRISTMDSFLYSIEQNLVRQMYISGFRILFLAENHITSTGNYINVDNFFDEAFFNGTVNGASDDILIGVTYDDLINSINQKANKINVEISLTNSVINITQEDPWHVKFSMVSNFVMQDKGGLTRWDKNQTISAFIPVASFQDPIYTINSYAKISRKIVQTPYEGNYVDGGDVSNLYSHVSNGYYSENINAPSFLKKLEGDSSADQNGIESFVNILEFSNQGISVSEKSCIDYIYFSSINPSYESVAGMQSWFRIDTEHKIKYQIP